MKKWREVDTLWMQFEMPKEYMKFLVSKGFISIDGTSLTICDVHHGDANDSADWFTVMLVPHTQQNIILPTKDIGDLVNIEVDVLSKFVESSVRTRLEDLSNKLEIATNRISAQDKILDTLAQQIKNIENDKMNKEKL